MATATPDHECRQTVLPHPQPLSQRERGASRVADATFTVRVGAWRPRCARGRFGVFWWTVSAAVRRSPLDAFIEPDQGAACDRLAGPGDRGPGAWPGSCRDLRLRRIGGEGLGPVRVVEVERRVGVPDRPARSLVGPRRACGTRSVSGGGRTPPSALDASPARVPRGRQVRRFSPRARRCAAAGRVRPWGCARAARRGSARRRCGSGPAPC